jgi:hypothetical protein
MVFDFLLSFLYFWSNLVEIKISNRKSSCVFDDFASIFEILPQIKVFSCKFVILCTFYIVQYFDNLGPSLVISGTISLNLCLFQLTFG